MSISDGNVEYRVLVRPIMPTGRVLHGNPEAQDFVYGLDTYSNYTSFRYEPWLSYAVAFSLDTARNIAGELTSSFGSDNVMIVKVIDHDVTVTTQ